MGPSSVVWPEGKVDEHVFVQEGTCPLQPLLSFDFSSLCLQAWKGSLPPPTTLVGQIEAQTLYPISHARSAGFSLQGHPGLQYPMGC